MCDILAIEARRVTLRLAILRVARGWMGAHRVSSETALTDLQVVIGRLEPSDLADEAPNCAVAVEITTIQGLGA